MTLDTKDQKTSYALGLDIGSSFSKLPIDVQLECFFAGVSDVFEGKPIQLEQGEFETVMREFQKNLKAEGEKKQQEAGTSNSSEGSAFLAENGSKDDVTTTATGLQYTVITEGEGSAPTAEDTVQVHYTGMLLDETVFDSSVKRGTPATFPLNRVIAGWTEGVQLMKVGSKYRFFVPPELAYGEQGAGQAIGPNATLIFDVELLSIGG